MSWPLSNMTRLNTSTCSRKCSFRDSRRSRRPSSYLSRLPETVKTPRGCRLRHARNRADIAMARRWPVPQPPDVTGDLVQETKVIGCVKDPSKGGLDEIWCIDGGRDETSGLCCCRADSDCFQSSLWPGWMGNSGSPTRQLACPCSTVGMLRSHFHRTDRGLIGSPAGPGLLWNLRQQSPLGPHVPQFREGPDALKHIETIFILAIRKLYRHLDQVLFRQSRPEHLLRSTLRRLAIRQPWSLLRSIRP